MMVRPIQELGRVLTVGLFVLAGLPALAADGDDPVTPETIWKAWMKRKVSVRTLRFDCDEQVVLSKGASYNQGAVIVPPEQTAIGTPYKLTMDGDRLRLWSKSIVVDMKKELALDEITRVSTERGFKSLTEPRAMPYRTGGEGSSISETIGVRNSTFVLPLLTVYRPDHAALTIYKDFINRFDVMPGGRSTVMGRPCIQVQTTSTYRAINSTTTLWLDPDRDFLMVRYATTTNGKPSFQLTFTDFRHGDNGWVPIGWTWTTSNEADGSVLKSVTTSVREFALNEPIDPKEFELEFPVGTWVNGPWKGEQTVEYIVQPGGEKRMIRREELRQGATYDQLQKSKTGEAFRQPASGLPRYLVWLIVACAALAVLAWILARRLRHRAIRT
jgi:hypothetical protein